MIKTELIRIYDPEQDAEGVLRAGNILSQGGLVAIPTETVYGLAANAYDETAVKAVYAAKGRPSDNPMIVHIAELSALPALVTEIPPAAQVLAEAFWPGPLTMILKCRKDVVPAPLVPNPADHHRWSGNRRHPDAQSPSGPRHYPRGRGSAGRPQRQPQRQPQSHHLPPLHR